MLETTRARKQAGKSEECLHLTKARNQSKQNATMQTSKRAMMAACKELQQCLQIRKQENNKVICKRIST